MYRRKSVWHGVFILLSVVVLSALVLGQPNSTFSGPTGADNTILGQGEGLIVFSLANPNTGLGDIWLAGGDGRCPINLTRTPNIDEFDPAVSIGCQQGGMVAYASDMGSGGTTVAIWIMSLDGTTWRQVTFPASGMWHTGPRWTSRCSEIMFLEMSSTWPQTSVTCNFLNIPSLAVRTVPFSNPIVWASDVGSGTMVKVRAVDANWVTTSIQIGLNHHAWLYVLNDPTDGPPCGQAGSCGLSNINLGLRLDSNPSCHVLISSYTPIYIDTAFLANRWNGQAGYLEMRFGDTERSDNSGGVIVILMPVAR